MRVLSLLVLAAAVAVAAAAASTESSAPTPAGPVESVGDFQERMRQLHIDSLSLHGALSRRVNHLKSSSDEPATARRLLSDCEDVLDDDGNMISYVDLVPEACTTCGYFEATGVTLPSLTCPVTTGNTTDLAEGSCCNDDSNCEDGLVCDLINNICTSTCEFNTDCMAGSWEDVARCTDTASVQDDYSGVDSFDFSDTGSCNRCDYAFQCSGVASFCSICTDYIGPVDAEIVTAAGCLDAGNDDTDSVDNDALVAMCDEDCAIDCALALSEIIDTAYTCLNYECGQGETLSIDFLNYVCSSYNGELCLFLMAEIEQDSFENCDNAGCCVATFFGPELASLVCPGGSVEICPAPFGDDDDFSDYSESGDGTGDDDSTGGDDDGSTGGDDDDGGIGGDDDEASGGSSLSVAAAAVCLGAVVGAVLSRSL